MKTQKENTQELETVNTETQIEETVNAGNQIEETVNVETQELDQEANQDDQNDETTGNVTPDQQKAAAILRARLPKLQENGLNFEKRSGNFFRATVVKEQARDENGEPMTNRDGSPVYVKDANGNPIEKVRRLVVDLEHETNAGTVEDCYEEINAKRAAAMVLDGERGRLKLEDELNAARKRVEECAAALGSFETNLANATEIVNGYELPERERVARIKVTEKLANVQDENAKLRALLISLGVDPDTNAES